ncbi:DUF1499 domain-containing protein [Sneathiella sp. P13V-1]|uniref:DUF1499 domain-containing protein n=1 Tax=Sneathiella sp. P13V-1 TaxID=2697366 RepID=UPI00187BB3DF|nr:DUF1499 domain-containing protein [Sneathiella sp. P13V-1]MBE7636630.1 DUF1499 domain-containing protein [Sneathiella sp. P13V-1]
MLQLFIYGIISLLILLVLLRLTPIWDNILSAPAASKTDFSTLKAPNKPNWFLLCDTEVCQNTKPNGQPPIFELSATDLKGRFEKFILENSNAKVRLDESDQIEILDRTSLVRWPDIISVKFVGLEGGKSILYIYSRSIYGHSDLGANQARVTKWLQAISE